MAKIGLIVLVCCKERSNEAFSLPVDLWSYLYQWLQPVG